jgi:hypothetical protein
MSVRGCPGKFPVPVKSFAVEDYLRHGAVLGAGARFNQTGLTTIVPADEEEHGEHVDV